MTKKVATRARPTLTGQIRDMIGSRGLTHTELGQLAGVDPTVIGRFVSGERDVRGETLDKIAAVFHLRVVEDAPPRPRGCRPVKPD
jgi:transcriptional regulator with XRE-family HTH domain